MLSMLMVSSVFAGAEITLDDDDDVSDDLMTDDMENTGAQDGLNVLLDAMTDPSFEMPEDWSDEAGDDDDTLDDQDHGYSAPLMTGDGDTPVKAPIMGDIKGAAADDELAGGDDADNIFGDMGNDELRGGAGADNLFGELGDDLLAGEDGDDSLFGGSGDDTILGYLDNDILSGDAGDDIVYGGQGNDLLNGGGGDDALLGGYGDDTLNGGYGMDTLNGGRGNDMVSGIVTGGVEETDVDYLNGGAGDDTITLGKGDLAHGGSGLDTFVLGDWLTYGSAEVSDFNAAEDNIVLVYSGDIAPDVTVTPVDDDPSTVVVALDGAVVATVKNAMDMTADDVTLLSEQAAAALS
ncbi:MAG: calcium-binding protein [Pseudomonadota bacterium]